MYRSEEQQRYANAVEQAIASPGAPALIQGGTGVGKTRGFLVPTVQSGKRVIIATSTTQLVNQILASEDLRVALKAGGRPVGVRPRFGLSDGREGPVIFCSRERRGGSTTASGLGSPAVESGRALSRSMSCMFPNSRVAELGVRIIQT